MSKTKKIWLGISAFAPLIITMIFVIVVLVFYLKLIFGIANESLIYNDGTEFLFFAIWIIIMAFLLNIIIYTSLIVFTICIIKNKRIGDTSKILYIIGMYFLTTIVPIIYFFIEVIGKNGNENKKIDEPE